MSGVDFPGYLAAKRTVDDRAINRRVLRRFTGELYRCFAQSSRPVDILEVGAGVGTMVARLAAWNALPFRVRYRCVDRDPEVIETAHAVLPGWLESAGYEVARDDHGIVARTGRDRLRVTLVEGDALDERTRADAVIAAAFLDIVPVRTTIHSLLGTLRPEGVVYAPITYDGTTVFQPPHPADPIVEALYHEHMDAVRDQPGTSRAGQHTLAAVAGTGNEVVAVGAADWEVSPAPEGYAGEEAVFLDGVLGMVGEALETTAPPSLEPEVADWRAVRTRQLDDGTLGLVAHNLDLLIRQTRG